MDRKKVIKISGLLVGLFAVFSLLSALSYLFTWKADQSLLGDPQRMDLAVTAANAAGQQGAGWGALLVSRWFGLGSFALVLALFIVAARMVFGVRKFSVVKAVTLSLAGAVILSFIFAFVSSLEVMPSLRYAFGGGLGGECGGLVVDWCTKLFGSILTAFAIVILSVLWLIFASRRFNEWFMSLGSRRDEGHADAGSEETAETPGTIDRLKGLAGKVIERIETVAEEGIGESDDAEEETTDAAPAVPEAPVAPDVPQTPAAPVAPQAPIAPAVPQAPVAPQSTVTPEVKPSPAVTVTTPDPTAVTREEAEAIEVVTDEDALSTDVVEELPRIDMRDELKNYRFPPLELLDDYEKLRHEVSQEELKRNNYKIRATLKTYKIDVDNVKAVVGPTVTLYKVYPAPGVKISSITNLQDDIAMALHAKGVRMEKLADSVGIEVANDQPSIVPLKAVLNDDAFRNSDAELPVAIGYTITQKVKVFDLADAPHLLVAGATKQGKSVGLNVLISSLLYSKHPSELKFVFIDPKMVEFSSYARLLKHYLAVLPDAVSEEDEMNNAICKNAKHADLILRSLCIEMDARYELMGKALVNKVTLYNEKYKDRRLLPTDGHHYMPYIVVVVDEYADLTMSVGGTGDAKAQARNISTSIIRLAQKGRAAGIHVVLATQRPSVDVVTGLIKSNFPTRIAFRVFSSTDSKTIIDTVGADKLIGRGDMIYSAGVDMERVQCAFLSNDEINAITEFVGDQKGYMKSYNTPYYLPAVEVEGGEGGDGPLVDMKHLDERFEEAARQVVTSQRGSTSDLQRKLGMGYAKAGRVMDQLEAAGIVGPQEGSKPRQVLVGDLAELQTIIDAFRNAQN